MKFTVALKNNANIRVDGIILSVAYYLKENDIQTPQLQEFVFVFEPNQERTRTVDLGNTASLEDGLSIVLKKGNGNVIKQFNYTAGEVSDKTLSIAFNPEENPSVSSDTPSQPRMVYGRLLDVHGKHKMEDVQIIVLAKRIATAPLAPIESFRTEAQGYFSFNYPEGEFAEAYAQIGMELTGNPITIHLEPASDPSKGLIFPKRLILMAGLANPATLVQEECDCGCNSLDFEDKRVLEEFSFYSVVRTTEPEIKGYIIEEDDEITLEEVIGRLPVSQLDIYDIVKNLRFAKEDPVIQLTIKGGLVNSTGAGGQNSGGNNKSKEEILKNIRNLRIQKKVLVDFLKEEKTISTQNISKLLEQNDASKLQDDLLRKQRAVAPLGRVTLNAQNSIDWDDEPTIYQAVEIAHGHLLQYKSEWIADGFSLGDLLYSLPLAPGQKKQIVVFDWERRESASNSQQVDFEEGLSNSLSRDRDILEVVKGSVAENISGSSSVNTAGVAAGAGGILGNFLVGVAGGWGHSSSNASQSSLRNTSASDLQRLRDRTVQSANAVRSLRSTVIQTVNQGERFEVSSESVANYNHCHAITIQYYEVLRHFKIRQRFAGARECLFVPLLMSKFDLKKALRWREALQSALIDRRLFKAFEAGGRVSHEWKDSNFPAGTYASEKILYANGVLKIKLSLQRPADNPEETDAFNPDNWAGIEALLGSFTAEEFYEKYLKKVKNKDDIFHRELGEKIARALVEDLVIEVLDESGKTIGTLPAETTLTSRYYRGGVLNVSLRVTGQSTLSRDRVHYLRIKFTDRVNAAAGRLPAGTSIVVQSGALHYRTRHFNGTLFNYKNIGDDLKADDSVMLYAGPSEAELRDPRKDDLAMVNSLIAHLNDNLEYYHKAIWLRMTPERRFMLLDGITIPPDRPESKGGGRSVASLVENELIGIAGNSLILPVASGLNLDPNFSTDKQSLAEYYMTAAAEPVSISIPTKGVFAEAVMGNCNSCEKIDESRFWRWEESPIPDSPTAINPINTDTRRADPGDLQPQALPAPILNIQNAPNAPDPTGLAATMGLLGQSNLFKDITGLEGNQKNAMQALQSSLDTAKAFGQEAAKLEVQRMMERRLDKAINAINNDESLDEAKKNELKEKAINAYLGGGATKEEEKKDPKTSQFEDGIKTVDRLRAEGVLVEDQANQVKDGLARSFAGDTETRINALIDKASTNGSNVQIGSDGSVQVEAKPKRVLKKLTREGSEEIEESIEGKTDVSFLMGAPSAPQTGLISFVLKNRVYDEFVAGCTVVIKNENISGISNSRGKLDLDLSSLPKGLYSIEITPRDIFTGVTYSDIGNPMPTTPSDRIWLPHTSNFTINNGTVTSAHKDIKIKGNVVEIGIQPVWMQTPNQSSRPAEISPDLIVIHHTGDERSPANIKGSLREWLTGATSTHYVIDKNGDIIKLCHESRQSYHAGCSHWGGLDSVNKFSIGIEIVHTNSGIGGDENKYTEQYTQEQYDSLVFLLNDLTSRYKIPEHRVVGHNDIATNRIKDNGNISCVMDATRRLGAKSSDPGRLFNWEYIENSGFGFYAIFGMVHPDVEYGGFFHHFPNLSLVPGDRDDSSRYGGQIRPNMASHSVISELQTNLRRIGYFCSDNGIFDTPTQWAVHMFNEHYFSGNRYKVNKRNSEIDIDSANAISGIVLMLQSNGNP